jgi:cysteine synthase
MIKRGNMCIEKAIGNTPLIKLGEKLYAKLETSNPTGSIKDRLALYTLTKAKQQGQLKQYDTIIEATSGNTGIAIAMLGSVRGHKVKIIMPRNMSEERKQMMRHFGAEIIEVGDNAFQDAIKLRDQMLSEDSSLWSPKQFENPFNIECHEVTTAREIIRQLFIEEKKNISALICGAGTGGTIMGVRRALIKLDKTMSTVLVAPAEDAKTHGIQGINDGADFLVDRSLIDGEIKISTHDATQRARQLARENGLFVGISAGANVLGAERWLEKNNIDGVAVTFLCDRGERYMSIF